MKQLFLFLILSTSLLIARASEADLFSYDKAGLESEMAELDALEQYVGQNQGITLQDLRDQGNSLAPTLSLTTASSLHLSEGPLGIPSFLWGFCFNIGGLAVVYFVAEDPDETQRALIGCIVSSLLYGGGAFWRFT